jgi:predicted nucleotidyltransferase
MAETIQQTASDLREVGSRIAAFLDRSRPGEEIRTFAQRLLDLGEVAIFGGMVRDFARAGAHAFASDVDLVVDADSESVADLLVELGAHRNRFGGYRIRGRHLEFDVWALKDTWAVRERHVEASCLEGLIATTFFDWDAAIYKLTSGNVHAKLNYLNNIQNRIIDINLAPNPNVLGAIVRTIRALTVWEGLLAPPLANFLLSGLSEYSPSDVEHAQRSAFGRVFLASHGIKKARRALGKNYAHGGPIGLDAVSG